MEEQLITYETAILAKEKGCEIINLSDITQSLLQKWLREEHNINMLVHYSKYSKTWDVESWHFNDQEPFYYGNKEFRSYEEALEEGLQEGLKLIGE